LVTILFQSTPIGAFDPVAEFVAAWDFTRLREAPVARSGVRSRLVALSSSPGSGRDRRLDKEWRLPVNYPEPESMPIKIIDC
jgi:hypothetical protein